MSVWTTKAFDRDREYIVIKHILRNVNYRIKGVRFRDGFGVVEKGSKIYIDLKRIPQLRKAQEFPLTFLKQLPFITRSRDVEMVYGREVYSKYVRMLELERAEKEVVQKEAAEEQHVEEGAKCQFRTVQGTLCKFDAMEKSPSGYCKMHILQDPKLEELGFHVPKNMTKKDRRQFKKELLDDLETTKITEE